MNNINLNGLKNKQEKALLDYLGDIVLIADDEPFMICQPNEGEKLTLISLESGLFWSDEIGITVVDQSRTYRPDEVLELFSISDEVLSSGYFNIKYVGDVNIKLEKKAHKQGESL